MEGGRQMGVSRMNLGRGNQEDQVNSKCTTLCQRSVNKTFLQDISDEGERQRLYNEIMNTTLFATWIYFYEARHWRVMTKWPLTSTLSLPHSLHAAPFSPGYLDVRPWKPSLDDRRGGRVPSQR